MHIFVSGQLSASLAEQELAAQQARPKTAQPAPRRSCGASRHGPPTFAAGLCAGGGGGAGAAAGAGGGNGLPAMKVPSTRWRLSSSRSSSPTSAWQAAHGSSAACMPDSKVVLPDFQREEPTRREPPQGPAMGAQRGAEGPKLIAAALSDAKLTWGSPMEISMVVFTHSPAQWEQAGSRRWAERLAAIGRQAA